MRTRKDDAAEILVGIETRFEQTRFWKQVARRRSRIDERKVLALQIGHGADTAVLVGNDLAVVRSAAGLLGLGHGKRLDVSDGGAQHIGERPEVGHIEASGAQRLDHAVVVGRHEGLDLHAERAGQHVHHFLAVGDHGARVLGRNQAHGQDLLRAGWQHHGAGDCGGSTCDDLSAVEHVLSPDWLQCTSVLHRCRAVA